MAHNGVQYRQFKGETRKGSTKMYVINLAGKKIDFNAAVNLMDNEIREEVHAKFAPCAKQKFFTEYEKAHEEKFGEKWELSKKNPIW